MSVTALGRFDPLVLSIDVDDQLLSTLRVWLPTYLARLGARVPTLKSLPVPRTYTTTLEAFEYLDHQMPAVVATTTAATATIGGPPSSFEATWMTEITAVLRGRKPPEARRLTSVYEGAVRAAVLQKSRDDGVVNHIRWDALRPLPVVDDTRQGRYLSAVTSTFTVRTDIAVRGSGGPSQPDADVYVPTATVTEVDVDVAGESVSIPGSGGSP